MEPVSLAMFLRVWMLIGLTVKATVSDLNTEKLAGVRQVAAADSSIALLFQSDSSQFENITTGYCSKYVNDYAKAAADFTSCSIKHARPLHFCGKCVDQYTKATEAFQAILEGRSEKRDSSCREILLRSDRVQLIRREKEHVDSTWRDCHCTDCYEQIHNGSNVLKNTTKHFFYLQQEVDVCFNDHHNVTHSNKTSNGSVCEACYKIYRELNDFYNELDKKTEHHELCMDIVDSMNATRKLWSRHFKCRRQKHDPIVVILISSIFCFLPVAFYAASRIHGGRAEQKILQEKRLKNSENSPVPSTSTREAGNNNQGSS